MDQKGHIIDQKGLKMYEKRQKIEFSDLKSQVAFDSFPNHSLNTRNTRDISYASNAMDIRVLGISKCVHCFIQNPFFHMI